MLRFVRSQHSAVNTAVVSTFLVVVYEYIHEVATAVGASFKAPAPPAATAVAAAVAAEQVISQVNFLEILVLLYTAVHVRTRGNRGMYTSDTTQVHSVVCLGANKACNLYVNFAALQHRALQRS